MECEANIVETESNKLVVVSQKIIDVDDGGLSHTPFWIFFWILFP